MCTRVIFHVIFTRKRKENVVLRSLAQIETDKNQLARIKKGKSGSRIDFENDFPKTIWIGGNPRAPLVESNEQVEQTVQAGKSRGVRGISPDAAIFLIYRRFAPFHRSVPSTTTTTSPPPLPSHPSSPSPRFETQGEYICNSKYDACLLN